MVAPPVIRLLGDLEMPTQLHHRVSLTKHSFGIPQLTNNLFLRVTPSLYTAVLLAQKGNRGLTQSQPTKGGGQVKIFRSVLGRKATTTSG